MNYLEVESPALSTVAGWKEVPVYEGGEPLVPLGMFSEYWQVETSSIYAGEHSNSPYTEQSQKLAGALITQFVRKGVAERLLEAQSRLPFGHHLVVFDAYRSLNVQQALYDHYHSGLKELFPDWSDDALATETQRYVSIPSKDSSRPSPHNTGGAVDLAVVKMGPDAAYELQDIDQRLSHLLESVPLYPDAEQEAYNPECRERYVLQMRKSFLMRKRAKLLEFGTPYDHGGQEAASAYYEERSQGAADLLARTNRRLLNSVMTDVGMQPYEEEWWHFNAPESQMGAKVAGIGHASYGPMELSAQNMAHERMRLMHHQGIMRLNDKTIVARGNKLMSHLLSLNYAALKLVGNPAESVLRPAVVIAPNQG